MMGHLGEVSNAAVAVNAHREQPSVSVLSRAMVAVRGTRWGKRNVGGPLPGRLCEPTTVVGWRFPGDFAKRGRK